MNCRAKSVMDTVGVDALRDSGGGDDIETVEKLNSEGWAATFK